jgi:hypothetical protein
MANMIGWYGYRGRKKRRDVENGRSTEYEIAP